ncbi:hypothetical protein PIB30_001405 [Stylosanthes scabra]|uniref:Uncharacterized protein n=1 Tax=Stylosanthes scabra TaxID=79078 RepID=A0ABU6YZK5_9FABA|nr:hypothetical protein [Stylosanthes scabra]
MAYRFFAVLPDRSCRYRVFWLINDEHVRAMFASHDRILSNQVMDLYVQILDSRTTTPGAGETESDGEDLGDSEGGSSGSGSGDDEFSHLIKLCVKKRNNKV